MVQQVGNFTNCHDLYNINNINHDDTYRESRNITKRAKHTHKSIYIIIAITNLIAIIAFLLHFINITPISGDTYIGIITTLMGVCTTFIVGFQIYNSIEYRAEIRKLQTIQERYKNDLQKMNNKLFYESNEAYIGIYMVQGITFKDKYLSSSLRSFLKSIVHSLNVNDIKRANIAIGHIVNLAQQRDAFIKALEINEIKEIITEMKLHQRYSFIEDRLDPFLDL